MKKRKRSRRPSSKKPQQEGVARDTVPPMLAKSLEPLSVRVHFPFMPPGTSTEEEQKILAPYRQTWSELHRRLLTLADVVDGRIRHFDEYDPEQQKQVTTDALEMAIAYGIEVDKAREASPDLAAIHREFAQRRKWSRANACLTHSLNTLFHIAVDGKNQEAAVALAGTVCRGVVMLYAACASAPDLFKPYARKVISWPLLVNYKGHTGAENGKFFKLIDLAADTIKPRIRDAQGGSEAREWARAIIETLEETRTRINGPPYIRDMLRLLEKEVAVTIQPVPEWVRGCAKLPPFGPDKAPLDAWKGTGAAMLKTECPEFHKHKDWDRFKARWDKNAMSEREKANRILDLIKDAMDTLAGARPSKRAR